MFFYKVGKDDKRVSGMQESCQPSNGFIQPPGTSLQLGEVIQEQLHFPSEIAATGEVFRCPSAASEDDYS